MDPPTVGEIQISHIANPQQDRTWCMVLGIEYWDREIDKKAEGKGREAATDRKLAEAWLRYRYYLDLRDSFTLP